jgi:RHS repeat-associated protein
MIDLSSGAVHYYFSDHLGSASVVTNATGTAIEQESDYYPYGGERILSAGANNYKFSSKERDSEWALDNFGARFYSSQLGRFMTGDWSAIPVPVPYATFENPQSLNLYMYRTPINAADLDGHAPGDQPLPDVKHMEGTKPEPNTVEDKAQNLSQKGLDFIKKWEKFSPTVYDASGKKHQGDWTIGYGHKIRPGEDFSKGITKAQALELLQHDVQRAVSAVNAGLKVSVTQNQFDALVSLAFNAGPGSVQSSHQMMQAVNAGHVTEENFTAYRFVHENGRAVESQGLLRRREEEHLMYSEGQY